MFSRKSFSVKSFSGRSWLFDVPLADLSPIQQCYVTRAIGTIYTEIETAQIVAYSATEGISVRTAIETLHAMQELAMPVFCQSPDDAITAAIETANLFVDSPEPAPVTTGNKQKQTVVQAGTKPKTITS